MLSFSDYIIKKNAIKNNFNYIKKYCHNTKICAVVKANAYGVGVQNIVRTIDYDIDFYAVACFAEAKKLREHTKKPILILNFVPLYCLDYCIDNNISITICNYKQMEVVKKYFDKKNINNNKIKVHLAINSGMNRLGFCDENEFLKCLTKLVNLKNKVFLEGVFTHFNNSEDAKLTQKQVCIFKKYLKTINNFFDVSKIIKHASNSLGAIKYNNYHFDMVRIGIALYGNIDAKNQKTKEYKLIKKSLTDVITVQSKIINITKIKKGQFVGYGKNYIAPKNMTIGTVPLGYADGIFRSYAKKGKVICNGKFCKIVGNICMDMFMIDLSSVNAKLFDKVILIGIDKVGNNITVCDVAKACDTISYEVLTNIKQDRFNVKYI